MKVEVEFQNGDKDCFDDVIDICYLKKDVEIKYYINKIEKWAGIKTETFFSKGWIKSITITEF